MARILYPRAYNASSLKVIHEVPPHIPLPVTEYGGTERVVQGLLHGLSNLGVDLTVRCSGDSFPDPQDRKKFNVVANTKKAYGMDASFFAPKKTIEGSLMELFSQVAAMPASQRPLIHAHTEDTHLMVARCLNQSVITTVHNLPKPWVQENFSDMPMIAISKAQAASSALKGFDFVRTVYNGVDKTLYAPNFNVENDAPLVFLGRIGAKKGADIAIDIAVRSNNRLVLAGPQDAEEPEFFEQVVEPALAKYPHLISYVGSVSDKKEEGQLRSSKCELLRNAKALIFPSCWPEPFGMVMPEAMACGTPVIALNYYGSSVNEIVSNGLNGYKFTHTWEAAEIVNNKLNKIDRHKVHADFNQRFTVEHMARGYLEVYKEIRNSYMLEHRKLHSSQQLSNNFRL